MKNREKFFVIFTITITILTILYIVKGNIEINNVYKDIAKINQEVGSEETVKDKYSDELEEGLQQYIGIVENEDKRFTAMGLYIKDIFHEIAIKYYTFYGPMIGVINLVFYSFSITLFIYFMLTLEYKNKKQYILTNICIFIMLLILSFLESILGELYNEGEIILYNNGAYYLDEILPLLYLVFLTGNAIKNKRKIQILNAVILDLVVIANAIYCTINWWFDITWDLVFGIFLILLVIEGIILLINKHVGKNKRGANR